MQESDTSSVPAALAPIAPSERIDALDVIRGFALLGIFLMNVEWFNRPIADLGAGMPADAQGVDWLAGWLLMVDVEFEVRSPAALVERLRVAGERIGRCLALQGGTAAP